MVPLPPKALDAVMSELDMVKSSNPAIGNLVKLRGLIYPLDMFPEGTSISVARAAALNKAPLHGAINVLVILVDFPDKPFEQASPKERFQKLLFTEEELSANEYYKRVSNGAISITGAVTGPYRMPFNLSYYANNASGSSTKEPNCRTMAQHAVEAMNADRSSGSLSRYDNNGDGYMNIWSCKWVLPNSYRTRDNGPNIYAFLTVPEDCQLGTCAHQIGNLVFGWPDMYPLDYSSAGLGKWCVMAGGCWNSINGVPGTLPCSPSAWCKVQQGWVNVVDVSGPAQVLQITDVKKGNNSVFQINIKKNGLEYLLIENRQRTDMDEGLPGAGLLVYHVDMAGGQHSHDWNGPRVMLLEADGRSDMTTTNDGDDGDPFPGSSMITEISDDTNPSTSSFDKTRSWIRISNISSSSEVMTCQVSTTQPGTSMPGDVPAAKSTKGSGKEVFIGGFAASASATLTPPAATAAAAPDHTDQLLKRLIAQDVLNASLLTELLQLLRQVATAQAVGNAQTDHAGGAAPLIHRLNGKKCADVNGGGVGLAL
eukprot:gene9977-10132_t